MPTSFDVIVKAMEAMHQNLTEATGGRPRALPTWRLLESLITLHPLADGAILPTPTARNPSHTIAALAERMATHVQ